MGILESSYKQLRTELQTTYAKWLFKSIFEKVSEFNADSIAVIKKDGKYRCMNMTGEFILPT